MHLFCSRRAGIFSRGGKLTARDGRTALMYACEKGHIEAARLLVDKGADVNVQNKSAWTCACFWGRRSFRGGFCHSRLGRRRILRVCRVSAWDSE